MTIKKPFPREIIRLFAILSIICLAAFLLFSVFMVYLVSTYPPVHSPSPYSPTSEVLSDYILLFIALFTLPFSPIVLYYIAVSEEEEEEEEEEL